MGGGLNGGLETWIIKWIYMGIWGLYIAVGELCMCVCGVGGGGGG